MNIIEFEEQLVRWRFDKYYHPDIDIVNEGFRPVSGKIADLCAVWHDGRCHFFYIERRLTGGTPFYPGNEIYFGHASTADLLSWEVHDPVMLIRPGTWEGAHVWAPFILPRDGRFVMAYTGINGHISQDIGLAFSQDLFEWRRWDGNPISPCRGREWAFWREDGIASCRDPHLLEHDGRVWMAYTANTREGATCIALSSSADLEHWQDHGPILVGPATGYEPVLDGGHPQGSLESCNLFTCGGTWRLIANASVRGTGVRNWIFESDRIDFFDRATGREFWPGSGGIEFIGKSGSRSLMACFADGAIRFGEVDWSAAQPSGKFVESERQLREWLRSLPHHHPFPQEDSVHER